MRPQKDQLDGGRGQQLEQLIQAYQAQGPQTSKIERGRWKSMIQNFTAVLFCVYWKPAAIGETEPYVVARGTTGDKQGALCSNEQRSERMQRAGKPFFNCSFMLNILQWPLICGLNFERRVAHLQAEAEFSFCPNLACLKQHWKGLSPWQVKIRTVGRHELRSSHCSYEPKLEHKTQQARNNDEHGKSTPWFYAGSFRATLNIRRQCRCH